jgi:hypothetical protein
MGATNARRRAPVLYKREAPRPHAIVTKTLNRAGDPTMIETATTVEARNRFSRLVNRVAFGRERLAITRRDIRRAGA